MPRTLVSARFLQRLNRFAIIVKLRDGRIVVAHLPNSGRLQEVLQDGNKFWLVRRQGENRKTEFDAIFAQDGDALVSIDARLPPKLLLEGIDAGIVGEFGKIIAVQTEVRHGNHRIDLKIVNDAFRVWWVETKSVTLVVNGVALFPDAPTSRGREHLKLLTQFADRGEKAAVVFVVQRNDAECFAPNESADPQFAWILQKAANLGVKVFAYKCKVTKSELKISEGIPVRLNGTASQSNTTAAYISRR